MKSCARNRHGNPTDESSSRVILSRTPYSRLLAPTTHANYSRQLLTQSAHGNGSRDTSLETRSRSSQESSLGRHGRGRAADGGTACRARFALHAPREGCCPELVQALLRKRVRTHVPARSSGWPTFFARSSSMMTIGAKSSAHLTTSGDPMSRTPVGRPAARQAGEARAFSLSLSLSLSLSCSSSFFSSLLLSLFLCFWLWLPVTVWRSSCHRRSAWRAVCLRSLWKQGGRAGTRCTRRTRGTGRTGCTAAPAAPLHASHRRTVAPVASVVSIRPGCTVHAHQRYLPALRRTQEIST
jgi:hypothetical protein